MIARGPGDFAYKRRETRRNSKIIYQVWQCMHTSLNYVDVASVVGKELTTMLFTHTIQYTASRQTMISHGRDETPEEELIDLLSCHRSDT